MSDDGNKSDLRSAALLAPLFAPLTIVVGGMLRTLAKTGLHIEGPSSVVAAILVTLIVTVYGAPLAYGATLLILWPAAALMREAGALSSWGLALIGGAGGAILFPMYLRLLDSRGTWDFFPGAGFAAGAAVGCAFWFIATRRRGMS